MRKQIGNIFKTPSLYGQFLKKKMSHMVILHECFGID